jgi:hypothetical protein
MRLAVLALSAAALAAFAAGCSDPVPQTPDGAWIVSTIQDDPTMCHIAAHNDEVGQLNDAQKIAVETDGVNGAQISCTVAPNTNGSFQVSALAIKDDKTLQITIPEITPKASKDAPALGAISYESVKTAVPYAGNCNFYFATSPPETVAEGKIWVAFNCAAIISGETMSTCPVSQGYALFESCLTTTGM